MQARKSTKPAPASKSKGPVRKPRKSNAPIGRYDDEVTRETIDALEKIAPDDEFEDYKPTSKAAW